MFDDAIRSLEQAVENLKQRRLVLANVKLPPAHTVLDAVTQLQSLGLHAGAVTVQVEWERNEEPKITFKARDDRKFAFRTIGDGKTLAAMLSEAYASLTPEPEPTPLEQSASLCAALPEPIEADNPL